MCINLSAPPIEGNAADFTRSPRSKRTEHTGQVLGAPGTLSIAPFFLFFSPPTETPLARLEKREYPNQSKSIPIITKMRL
jgi:hypothetical protein